MGAKYVGKFKDDDFNGKGIYYWIEGDRYEGEWKNARRRSTYLETEETAPGIWKKGKMTKQS